MHEYEFRILNDDGSTSLICEEIQLRDTAAILSAKRIANGRPFEVWRGLNRIVPLSSDSRVLPVQRNI